MKFALRIMTKIESKTKANTSPDLQSTPKGRVAPMEHENKGDMDHIAAMKITFFRLH